MTLKTEAELDAEALRDHTVEITRSRRFVAVLWGFVCAFALAAAVFKDGHGLFLSFIAAVITSFITIAMSKLTRDERLVRPTPYRIVASAMLAISLFGVVLAFLPNTSETSKILGVFFGLNALFCYRSVVARGASTAMWAVVFAMWVWIPFAAVSMLGCGRYRREPNWTEVTSLLTLRVFLLALPVLAVVALISFWPRRDFVPDARVVRR